MSRARPLTFLPLLLAGTAAWGEEPVRADLHVHFTMKDALRPFFRGESGAGKMAQTPDELLRNQVDTQDLIRAGVRVVVASVWPPAAVRAGLSARDVAVEQLDGLRDFALRHPEVHLATSAQDAREALARGQLALIPAVEGGEGIESPDDVDLYYQHGARLMTVVHIMDCDLGGSAKGQISRMLGAWARGEHNPRGLSELGKATVARMIALGMAIDVSHASDASAHDMLELAERAGVPAVYTHGAARAFLPIERNLSDEVASRVVRGGGMVGTTLKRDFLAEVPDSERWSGYQPGTCDDVVAAWKHFAKGVGADNVVLGSDFNGMVVRPAAGAGCPAGIRTTADLVALYQTLAAHGVPQSALDRGGLRFLDVLEKVEQRADPAAQARARNRHAPPPSAFNVAL